MIQPEMRILLLLLLGLFLNLNTSKAQSFKDDYKRFVETYSKSKYLSYDVDVKGYDIEGKIKEKSYSKIRKNGNNYKSEIDEITTIINDDCALIINKKKKLIVCQPHIGNNEEEEEDATDAMLEQIDEIFEFAETEIKYIGKSNFEKHYSLELDAMGIKTMNIHFNVTTGFISRIEYIHDKEVSSIVKTIIKYKDFIDKESPKLTTSTFSEKGYVNIRKGNVTLTAAYGNYELIVSDLD